ncbi:MAG: mannose-1-phosphate guanylyltransferase [Lepagella sp.]
MEKRLENTYCVIMCGGVGSRFWPFSRQDRPKQFIDFFGTGRSLLQTTVDRALELVDADHVLLITNAAYAPVAAEQLPMIPAANILSEPARRNTAPCICWAAHHIAARDPKAAIVTMPSDHLILRQQAFEKAIARGVDFVRDTGALLTLGIRPTGPNTGYGYIQQGKPVEDWPGILKVKSFTEKPDLQMAEFFLRSGEFYWNAGIFLWRADAILRAFAEHDPETGAVFSEGDGVYGTPGEMNFIGHAYPSAPSNSIDYAIMEKADNVYVQTVDLGWSDLGTWRSLHEMSPRTREGNVTQNCKVLTQDCANSVFAIAGDKIVVAAGLDGYIVADNGNALLIYPIDQEQKVKQIVNEVGLRFGEKYI